LYFVEYHLPSTNDAVDSWRAFGGVTIEHPNTARWASWDLVIEATQNLQREPPPPSEQWVEAI
jgi:hypothetical protein